jgi:hypothetical protein
LLDNTILLHKQLAEILENFTNDFRADLEDLNQKMMNNGHGFESYFERLSSNVEDWASKVRGSFESVSVDVEVNLASLI